MNDKLNKTIDSLRKLADKVEKKDPNFRNKIRNILSDEYSVFDEIEKFKEEFQVEVEVIKK